MKYEQAVLRLEEIITKLSSGSAALDESLALFEEGASLVRLCNQLLSEAEEKIEYLLPKENA